MGVRVGIGRGRSAGDGDRRHPRGRIGPRQRARGLRHRQQVDALADQLVDVLRELRNDPAKRVAMAEAARAIAKPDAAARVADIVLDTIRLQEAA